MRFNKKIPLLFASAFFSVLSAGAAVSFSCNDVTPEDELLYSARWNVPGSVVYDTLFSSKLGSEKALSLPMPLTCFPEKMELIQDGKILQLRNRCGTAWCNVDETSPDKGKIEWIARNGRIEPGFVFVEARSASPDGKWMCFVRKSKNAEGSLVLMNSKTLEEKTLCSNAALDFDDVQVRWSPDSRFVLYEKNDCIYFINPESAFRNIQVDEEFRKIGEGKISSVAWTDSGKIVFMDRDIVYSIDSNELYTRGLYNRVAGIGTIIARLPQSFECGTDRFFTNRDASELIVVADKKFASYYSVPKSKGYSYVDTLGFYSLPKIRGTVLEFGAFWTRNGKPLFWTETMSLDGRKKITEVYSARNELVPLFASENSVRPQLSPDKKHLALSGGNSVCVFDAEDFSKRVRFGNEKVLSVVWKNSSQLFAGGENTVTLWNADGKLSETVSLSSATGAVYSGGKIHASSGNKSYCYDKNLNAWTSVPSVPEKKAGEVNGRFRAGVSYSDNQLFEGSIYVHSLCGDDGIYSLLEETSEKRVTKKVALSFDAFDSAEGVAKILSVLDKFNLKAAFFINGEFIRRYPAETKQIALSGNICASSFCTQTVLLGTKNYVIDEEYIKRGLARNEDEFFAATGKEFDPLWYAPRCMADDKIRAAGKSAGYTYVDVFRDLSGVASIEQNPSGLKVHYITSHELVDACVFCLDDGMILSISTGRKGGNKDSLYEELELLISAILDNGYEIVPVQSLVSAE